MNVEAYSAELASAMEAGFNKNPNTGEHCHSLADAYMASLAGSSLPEDVEAREEYHRLVAWSLEDRDVSPGQVVTTFYYIRVKAVRVAMKVALRRGEIDRNDFID